MLWWGSFLGAVREQAMIAWDYDVDIVCFVRPHVCMTTVWHGVSSSLRALGYTLSQHGMKFRVSPHNPLTWAPWQELCQEVRERNPKLSRREILQTAASHRQQGQQAKQPHGKNCVDIEFYHITERAPIEVAGSRKNHGWVQPGIPIGNQSFRPSVSADSPHHSSLGGRVRINMSHNTCLQTVSGIRSSGRMV